MVYMNVFLCVYMAYVVCESMEYDGVHEHTLWQMSHKCMYVSGLVWFGLVRFYGISTFVGYLMPNPFLCK